MTLPAQRDRVVAVATALLCGAVSIALLLALPALTAADADLAGDLSPTSSVPWWCTLATLALQAAALTTARARPRTALATVLGLSLALSLVGPGAAFTLTVLAVLVAVFLAVPRRLGADLALLLPLTALAVATGTLLNGLRSGISTMPGVLWEAAVQGGGSVGLTALVALVLTALRTAREARRSEVEALSRERDALARERDAQVRAAASEERAAMARELHDIAAHHLSGIALLTAAADRQIDTDPSAAHASLQQVRTQTREVLDDVRGVVGLLRAGGPAQRSVENLAAVPALLDARAEAGLPLEREVRSRPGAGVLGEGIGPLAQLVAYRTVQEALSNAAHHAPGAICLVTLDDRAEGELVVEILSGPAEARAEAAPRISTGPRPERLEDGQPAPSRPGPGGFGLIGMRERADLVGARLEAGPTREGTWRVRLTLTRDDTAGSRASTAAARSGETLRAAAPPTPPFPSDPPRPSAPREEEVPR